MYADELNKKENTKKNFSPKQGSCRTCFRHSFFASSLQQLSSSFPFRFGYLGEPDVRIKHLNCRVEITWRPNLLKKFHLRSSRVYQNRSNTIFISELVRFKNFRVSLFGREINSILMCLCHKQNLQFIFADQSQINIAFESLWSTHRGIPIKNFIQVYIWPMSRSKCNKKGKWIFFSRGMALPVLSFFSRVIEFSELLFTLQKKKCFLWDFKHSTELKWNQFFLSKISKLSSWAVCYKWSITMFWRKKCSLEETNARSMVSKNKNRINSFLIENRTFYCNLY